MDQQHPIDAEIRAWLKSHIDNESQLSVAAGHSTSWLHKYINGQGHATIDDLVRIAALLLGVNLPALSETERRLLEACRGLDEPDLQDVIAYVKHRGRLARNAQSKESSAPTGRSPRATTRAKHG